MCKKRSCDQNTEYVNINNQNRPNYGGVNPLDLCKPYQHARFPTADLWTPLGWNNIIDSTALCPESAAKNTQPQQHDLYFIHFRKLCDIVQSSMGTHTLSHSHSLTHTRKSSSRTGWLDFCLQTLCIESQFRVESNLNWSGDKTMPFIRGTVVASWRSMLENKHPFFVAGVRFGAGSCVFV